MGEFINRQPASLARMRSEVTRWHASATNRAGCIERVIHAQAGQEWVPHWHDELSVGAVVRGHCQFTLGGQLHRASEGDLLSIAPNSPHSCTTSQDKHRGPVLIVMFYVSPTWLHHANLALETQSRLVHSPTLAQQAATLDNETSARRWLLDALALLQRGAVFPQQGTSPPPTAQRVLTTFHDLAQKGDHLSVDTMARQCAVSRKQLHRTVTRWTGMSPDQYQRAVRINQGREHLTNQTSVSQAAQATGFADQAHFTRWYQRVYGYTPGAFLNAPAPGS